MLNPSLRVFPETNTDRRERELDRLTGLAEPKTVSIPLGKMVPLLMDAARNDSAWLDDFADDLIRIDADLYEVLLAYRQLRHRSAA